MAWTETSRKQYERKTDRYAVDHLIAITMHSANLQDRDGAPGVFARLRCEAPKLTHVLVNGGNAGPKLRDAVIGIGRWTTQIVKRPDAAQDFEALLRR